MKVFFIHPFFYSKVSSHGVMKIHVRPSGVPPLWKNWPSLQQKKKEEKEEPFHESSQTCVNHNCHPFSYVIRRKNPIQEGCNIRINLGKATRVWLNHIAGWVRCKVGQMGELLSLSAPICLRGMWAHYRRPTANRDLFVSTWNSKKSQIDVSPS